MEAYDINELIIKACKVVERHKGTCCGTVDIECFEIYVEQCLVPLLGKYNFTRALFCCYFDNPIIHSLAGSYHLIRNVGALILLTAPNSLHLNPIKYFICVYTAEIAQLLCQQPDLR